MSSIHPRDEAVVKDLRAAVDGAVIDPEHPDFEEARAIWNGAIDRRPAAIVRATSAADVAAGTTIAREHDRPLAIRGGGHHVAGVALVDDGIVIDLGELTGVVVDPDERVARVEPGARVSDVLDPAQDHGLAPVVGSASQTGVAGSTLAGGIGWLRRAHGLGVDTLREVEVVTADGEMVTASESENPDLFWAIRGAGANVGVVTRFDLDLVAVGPEVAVAQPIYPLEDAGAVLDGYREFAVSAPPDVTTLVTLMRVPPLPDVPEAAVGAPVVMILGVASGDIEEGATAMAPLRDLGTPVLDMSGSRPLAAVHDVARLLFPDGRAYSWHSMYGRELGDGTIETLVGALETAPTAESDVGIWQLGGAIDDVASDETAFGFREPAFLFTVEAGWDDPSDADACRAWAHETWTALRGDGATIDGFYPGFPGFVDGEERVRMAYGDNVERIAATKAAYDPENVFRQNLNVEPAS